MIYEPREDSLLLRKYVKRYSKGLVLDIGTGSGIQAIEAAKKADKVIATDISEEAIRYCKKNIKNKKIVFISSDLFEFKHVKADIKSIIKDRFDLVIFNPPYLPKDKDYRDKTIEGGKHGYEAIQRFLGEVSGYLKPDGKVLLLFSSLTNKSKIDDFINQSLLKSKLLKEKRFFFEMLYVYLIWKSNILKKLEENLNDIRFLAKGHRGILYTANFGNKKLVIKLKNPESKAKARIRNEANWLKRLNKFGIGPKILFKSKKYLVYEFIEGNFILDFIKGNSKTDIIKAIKNIFNQLYVLDSLCVNKEEMHHPIKHIIISKNKRPVLIDFERCHKTLKPKNVTQFIQFLLSNKISTLLKSKDIEIRRNLIIRFAKIYKTGMSRENLNTILGCINQRI